MNILNIKLSSLGDVIHAMPMVWDLRARYPHAHIDWLVEEAYVELLEPLRQLDGDKGLDRIIPVALRRWRKEVGTRGLGRSVAQLRQFRELLRQREYDLVLDTQGLIKSAVLTRLARRTRACSIVGFAHRTQFSGFEPMAKWFYTRLTPVPEGTHAVDRARAVAARAMDLAPPAPASNPPRFYAEAFRRSLAAGRLLPQPYALCLHASARASKHWIDEGWQRVTRQLQEAGLRPVFPWGNEAERLNSERLARQSPGSLVPARFSLRQALGVVAGARMVVGVDTGLTHLAAALQVPTVEIYVDSWRGNAEGYWSSHVHNLGDRGAPPSIETVMRSVTVLLQDSGGAVRT